eukprot:jgi/Tetstr1/430495/TSEL_020303.t1
MSDWLSTSVRLVGAAPPAGTSWTSHSLRKGVASAANAVGVPLSHIRYQGGWATNSDVVLDYIDPNVLPSPGAWFFFGHIAPLRHFQVQQNSAAVAFPLRVTSLNIKLMALLHAAGQSKPLGRLQRHIYWLNSLGLPHGMLVNGAADLADGRALEEAIDHLLGVRAGECPGEGGGGGFQDLRAALGRLAARRGWAPADGGSIAASASGMLAGEAEPLCDVLGFLEGLAQEEPHLAAPSPRVRAAALPSALSTTLVGTRATGAVPDRRGPPSGTPSLRHLMATRSSDCAQLDARDRLGLARALDSTSIEVDDSVRIGSQNTAGAAASGVASSNPAAASSHGTVTNRNYQQAGSPAGPSSEGSVRWVPRSSSAPGHPHAGGAEQRDREEDREIGAEAESFAAFMSRMAADLVAGRVLPSPEDSPITQEGQGAAGSISSASPAPCPPLSPSSPAAPAAASPQPLFSSRLDALTRLAEASDQEMEAVAESLSGPSSRAGTPPRGATPATSAPPPPPPQAPPVLQTPPSDSGLRGDAAQRKSSARPASAPRPSRPSPSPRHRSPARFSPLRLRDVKPKVDTGAVRRKPARSTPRSTSPASQPGLGAQQAGQALQAAAARVVGGARTGWQAQRQPRHPSPPPRRRWQSPGRSLAPAGAVDKRKAYIELAAQRARRPVSADVIVARTRHGVGPAWFKKALGKDGQAWLQRLMDEGHVAPDTSPAAQERGEEDGTQGAR